MKAVRKVQCTVKSKGKLKAKKGLSERDEQKSDVNILENLK